MEEIPRDPRLELQMALPAPGERHSGVVGILLSTLQDEGSPGA